MKTSIQMTYPSGTTYINPDVFPYAAPETTWEAPGFGATMRVVAYSPCKQTLIGVVFKVSTEIRNGQETQVIYLTPSKATLTERVAA